MPTLETTFVPANARSTAPHGTRAPAPPAYNPPPSPPVPRRRAKAPRPEGDLPPPPHAPAGADPPIPLVRVALRHGHARRDRHGDRVAGEGDQDHPPSRRSHAGHR